MKFGKRLKTLKNQFFDQKMSFLSIFSLLQDVISSLHHPNHNGYYVNRDHLSFTENLEWIWSFPQGMVSSITSVWVNSGLLDLKKGLAITALWDGTWVEDNVSKKQAKTVKNANLMLLANIQFPPQQLPSEVKFIVFCIRTILKFVN